MCAGRVTSPICSAKVGFLALGAYGVFPGEGEAEQFMALGGHRAIGRNPRNLIRRGHGRIDPRIGGQLVLYQTRVRRPEVGIGLGRRLRQRGRGGLALPQIVGGSTSPAGFVTVVDDLFCSGQSFSVQPVADTAVSQRSREHMPAAEPDGGLPLPHSR